MALSTYADLQSAIAEWAWRDDTSEFVARVPDIIALAEKRINRRLKLAGMETTTDLTPDANGVCTLPADFGGARRVTAKTSPRSVLSLITPDQADSAYPSNEAATARFYTIIGNKLATYPKSTADIELVYYAGVSALSDSNTTNWMLTANPDVYLYACQIEAATYEKNFQEAQSYGVLFDKAIDDVIMQDRMSRYAGAVSRVRGPTP